MNILLIHGACHDRSCWDPLLPHLESRGFRARALSLSGCGDDRTNPFRVTMHTWAKDICRAAESMGGRTVLVGHSMGGFSISLAGERRPDLFTTLIYLSALVPRSSGARFSSDSAEWPNDPLDRLVETSLFRGTMTFRPEAAEIFASECSAKQKVTAAESLCPQPLRPSFTKFHWTEEKLGSIPKHYVECSLDKALLPPHQRALRTHMKFNSVRTLDSDHAPFLLMPEQLASLLAELSPGGKGG